MNISEEKIILTAYNVDTKPHITLNEDICNSRCKIRFCTFICPAGCFVFDEDQNKVVFSFEGCLECGTCRIACDEKRLIGTTQKADMESFSVCRNY